MGLLVILFGPVRRLFMTQYPVWFDFRYLALSAALATEADFVFAPEWPPDVNWPSRMCKKLEQASISFDKDFFFATCY